MIYTLFFSRFRELHPTVSNEYRLRAAALAAHARENHSGFVDLKTFVAEDGERLTVVRFEDDAAHEAWSRDALHRHGKRRGREAYYSEYRVTVCRELRTREWRAEG